MVIQLTLEPFVSLIHKQGPLARVGLNTVVNANPDSVVKVLQPRSGYKRSLDYQAARFRPGSDNILSMRDEDAHKTLKAKTTAGVFYEPDHSL